MVVAGPSSGCDNLDDLRQVSQDEAEQMREALKGIASFYNPAQKQDSGQAAALTARKTLEELELLSQKEAQAPRQQRNEHRDSA